MVLKILNINVVEWKTGSAQYDNTCESGKRLTVTNAKGA